MALATGATIACKISAVAARVSYKENVGYVFYAYLVYQRLIVARVLVKVGIGDVVNVAVNVKLPTYLYILFVQAAHHVQYLVHLIKVSTGIGTNAVYFQWQVYHAVICRHLIYSTG